MKRASSYLLSVIGAASFAIAPAACTDVEGPDVPEEADGANDVTDTSGDLEGILEGAEVVASVRDPQRGYVALIEHPDRPGDVGIAIMAVYPHAPLLAPDFVEHRDPVEAFVAALDPAAPLPDAVASRLPGRASRLVGDVEGRAALHAVNEHALATFSHDDVTTYDNTVCSTSFRNWVDSVYGGDGTCGQVGNGAFSNTNQNRSYSYDNGMADFTLGALDHNDCEDGGIYPDGHCASVTGNLAYRRQRVYNYQGNGEVSYVGHRQHYGLGNCAGNGSVSFVLRRGESTDGNHSVPVGAFLHYFWGSDLPSTRATIDVMSYGSWKHDKGESGSSFIDNQIEWSNNAGADDKIIVCGEIQRSITMSKNDFACGPNISLCTGGGTCDSTCYSIVGL